MIPHFLCSYGYMNKILIEIAAYRDPDLLNTVSSAIKQADYPERVFFAICYQGDKKGDYEALEKNPNIKLQYLKESEVKGLCYARHSYIYHRYFRKNRAIPDGYAKGKEEEESRLKDLIDLEAKGMDLGRYGLGIVRSLADFEADTGIVFLERR